MTESIRIQASPAEVWERYFDSAGWPAWVDGFASVISSEGYPEPGGTLRWRSLPAGRGEVSERVIEHRPRQLHRIAFRDPESEGELCTELSLDGEATRLSQSADYTLTRSGPFGGLTDLLFVRGQVRGSLRRSLERLKREVEEIPAAQGDVDERRP